MSKLYQKLFGRYMEEAAEGGDAGGSTEPAQTNEVEDKARRMGWVPKEEFKGDPNKWRPADEFVERGENELPIMRERLRHQDKQLAELKETIKQFADYHSKTEQRAYQQAYTDLKQRQIQAVADGNTAEFVKLDGEIQKLTTEIAEAKPITVPQDDPTEHPEYKAWKTKNGWFESDKEMTAYANNIGAYIRQTTDLSGMDFLHAVTKEVKAKFPSKFENPRRNEAPAVEGSSASPRKGGKSYADLPAEAKAACDKFVKQGLIKSRDEYVKSYDWE